MLLRSKEWAGIGILLAVLPVGKAAGYAGAVEVISYSAGQLPGGGYTNPQVALGEPERYTGEGVFPGVVSPFNPPFLPSEIVSIGEGGQLTLRLQAAATNSPAHPYGADLIVFGNSGFVDSSYPAGMTTTPAALFGADGGIVEVSADGVNFTAVPGAMADGLFPTLGYLDAGPYDAQPGQITSDFARPVNPGLTLAQLSGLSYAQLISLFDGSGGGAPIDIGLAGLMSAAYVRISVPDDGNPSHIAEPVEIDAVTVVPEPSFGLAISVVCGAIMGTRRRWRHCSRRAGGRSGRR